MKHGTDPQIRVFSFNFKLFLHILLTDSLFDVCNSRSKFDGRKNLRCGYGIHYEEQLDAMLKGYNLIKGLRAKGKRVHMPWQRGFMISCSSILRLHDELKNKYGTPYILTSRLNQDVTEGTFSVLRRMGGTYTNPTPLSFAQRLKNYLLGCCSDVVVESAAVRMETIEVLTAESVQETVEDEEDVNEEAAVLTAEVGHGLELEGGEDNIFDDDDIFTDEDIMAGVSECKIPFSHALWLDYI